jgi:hypothetical protein
LDHTPLGVPEENPVREAWPKRAVRRRDLERFVNQNLHGKTDERNGNGRPPEDRMSVTTN